MKEMSNTRAILWFKNDLRLLDNESLTKAISGNEEILPIYIVDPRHFEKISYPSGSDDPVIFAKAGLNRFQFLCQSVMDLKSNLQDKGADLLIKTGKPEEIIPALIRENKIDSVYAEEEYAPEELHLIDNVRNAIPKDVKLHLTWGKTLYHKEDIPYTIDKIPMTSKAFRVHTSKAASVRALFKVPEVIPVINLKDWGELPQARELPIDEDKKLSPYVAGGETNALKRLDYYSTESELLTSYKWTRNRSLGMDYSSKLSPYLAVGAISPRTIYFKVKEYETTIKKNISTWWLVFEIVWRDFFTFKGMRMGSAIFKTEGYKNKDPKFENNLADYKRWCTGTTGIPFIDAHMRQLNATGYMSNRGRVNCASYFVHDLKIDWTWGAAYFESKLIDYDVPANWMNWHMQAYEIWYTNPINQSIKYKLQDYIRKWVPELAHIDNEVIYIPWKMESPPQEYPAPIAVYSKWSRAETKILKAIA